MKVAVTSTGPTLDDQVEARFGRCPYFLIVDTDSMQFEAVENPNITLGGGAGIQSAQMMAEKGVSHVLTGNCGPNAFRVFGEAGIAVLMGVTGPARQAVERFKAGGFSSASTANVQSHFGMGAGEPQGQALDVGLGSSAMGMTGMGTSRGGGMGGGRGGSMGGGMRRAGGFGAGPPVPTAPQSQNELQNLKEQAEALKQQKQEIEARRAGLQSGRKIVALVHAEECTGCGICAGVCPNDAIRIDKQAVVDPDRCTACAACVSACPTGAIVIAQQRV